MKFAQWESSRGPKKGGATPRFRLGFAFKVRTEQLHSEGCLSEFGRYCEVIVDHRKEVSLSLGLLEMLN